MSFNVEVIFTGLGLVWIKSGDDIADFEFLMLKDDHHSPRFSFLMEDLKEPLMKKFPWLTDANGATLVQEKIKKEEILLEVVGGNTDAEVVWAQHDATEPDCTDEAPVDAIDWIPSVKDHYGIDDLIDLKNRRSAFNTIVSVNPKGKGRLASRKLLWDDKGRIAKWTFGGEDERVLAEQVVWTCEGVDSVTVPLDQDYVFEVGQRELCGEEVVHTVTLAFTNLPGKSQSNQYPNPDHFWQFYKLSKSGKSPKKLERKNPVGPETLGGSCPPSRYYS